MAELQALANNQLLDAEVLAYLSQAWDNATAAGAAPELAALHHLTRGLAEAISRLEAWDFSTPTGIQQGFDPGDNPLALPAPRRQRGGCRSQRGCGRMYAMWRGQVMPARSTGYANAVPLAGFAPGSAQAMTAFRKLLADYAVTGGTGASFINFFQVPGRVGDQLVARDVILLGTLQAALDLCASDDFAPAFGNCKAACCRFRWGKLHRIIFSPIHSALGADILPACRQPGQRRAGPARLPAGGMRPARRGLAQRAGRRSERVHVRQRAGAAFRGHDNVSRRTAGSSGR